VARLARFVVPQVPHHVTQRGTRRLPVFFTEADYRRYLELLAAQAHKWDLKIWAYCLMPNHVHLIATPAIAAGLARPIGEAHRRYALRVNRRQKWKGHLWQERFCSCPMDEIHLLFAARYVLLNPVRAGLVGSPAEWPYSSARAHLRTVPHDPLVDLAPLDERVADWEGYLAGDPTCSRDEVLRRHSRSGRPLGVAPPVATGAGSAHPNP
jgi:putative transposase